MNDAEKEAIIQEVLSRLGEQKQVANRGALIPTHSKWFRDEQGHAWNSLMTKAFGESSKPHTIWEFVRRATCCICGVQYVNQLPDAEKANKVADRLCQLVYDMAIEERKKQ